MNDEKAREAAAKALAKTYYGDVSGWGQSEDDELARMNAGIVIDAYLSALSSHPDEETVTTVEELDALPTGGVIEFENVVFLVAERATGRVLLGTNGQRQPMKWAGMLLPARVLYRPTTERDET